MTAEERAERIRQLQARRAGGTAKAAAGRAGGSVADEERAERIRQLQARRSGGTANPAATATSGRTARTTPAQTSIVRPNRRRHRAAAARTLAAGISASTMFGIMSSLGLSHAPGSTSVSTGPSPEPTPPPTIVEVIVRHHQAVVGGAPSADSTGAAVPASTGSRLPNAIPAGGGVAAVNRNASPQQAGAAPAGAVPAGPAPVAAAVTTLPLSPPSTSPPTTVSHGSKPK
jgi:hypothetical protein